MALIVPICAFLIGYFAVEQLKPLRPMLAASLARVFIPILIIYNMVFYQLGSLWLVGLSFVSSIIFFSVFYLWGKDKLLALCLSYLNGAWLGLPFALAVFGKEATNTIVALYIGGSLFGNICAVMAVSQIKQSTGFIVKNVLQAPPVIALTIAGVLSFWDLTAYQHSQAIDLVYQINKFLVTFAGMCVLGMWLSKVKIQLDDVYLSLRLIFMRMLIAVGICLAAYFVLPIPQHALTYAVIFMFFCLPPAANIVALETHYQGTGHSVKYIASGTIASAFIISIYGIIVHSLGVLN